MSSKPITDNTILTQSNHLIESAYENSLIEMRLLFLALTKIDSRNPQPEGEYTIRPKEYQELFSLHDSNSYEQLRTAVDSLARKPLITYEWNEKKQHIEKVQRSWFSIIRYAVTGDSTDIMLRFSDSVSAYLYELKTEFTQINLIDMVKLDSPFAFRLYTWLFKYINLKAFRNADGVVSTAPLQIDWMKERTGLAGKYPQYKEFKRRVLDPAIDVINAHTRLSVTYEPVKQGRNVQAIICSYIEESKLPPGAPPKKPIRPRLASRPRVAAGSAKEREWALKNLHTLHDYEKALKQFDPKLKLSAADRKKFDQMLEITGLTRALL